MTGGPGPASTVDPSATCAAPWADGQHDGTLAGASGSSEERYRRIFEGMPIAVAVHDVVCDGEGTPVDYVFRAVNAAFERMTGLRRETTVGRPVTEVIPGILDTDPDLVRLYGAVALGGPELERDLFFEPFAKWYHLHVFSDRPGSFVVVFTDVTAAKATEAEARRTTADLKRSNEELEQFAYIASHDLQEPLRMVASYTQLLADRYRGRLDEKADRFIGHAVDGARRMQGLINDLLALSRVGRLGRTFAPTDCAAIVADLRETLHRRLVESGGELRVDALPVVLGDATQIGQLFLNLIGNALKFHGAEPPIVEVGATRDGSRWAFAVRDNGIGIEPEFHERIFLAFQRLHPRGAYEGTGIGLALAKKIVERHGGRLTVESSAGHGACFRFTLPAVPEG